MTEPIILANARLILETEVVTGSLTIKDGVIADLAQGADVPKGAVDLGGDYLAPRSGGIAYRQSGTAPVATAKGRLALSCRDHGA